MPTIRGNGNEPPHINGRHIDGPVVIFSDGQMHWLTYRERIGRLLGYVTAEYLQRKYQEPSQ